MAVAIAVSAAGPSRAAGTEAGEEEDGQEALVLAELQERTDVAAETPEEPGAPPARGQQEVEQIVVTAQKRAQRLTQTPISITAFTQDALWSLGVNDVRELRDFAPNLNIIANTGGNTGSTINIRGAVTSDPIITLDPTVGVYLDDVYIAKSVGSLFDIIDLSQVEVLRGPQGTLYGRNTNGGAIRLVTRRPSGDWGVRSRVTAGNYDQINYYQTLDFAFLGENGFNGSDELGTFSGYATFATLNRDFFFKNRGGAAPGTGPFGPAAPASPLSSEGYDDIERLAGFVKALYEPTDWLDVEYRFDITHADEQPTAFQLSGVRPGAPFEAFQSPFVRGDRRDPFTPNDFSSQSDLDLYGHAGTITVDLPYHEGIGQVTLKSITGYRKLENEDMTDLDGTNFQITQFALDIDHEQVTQELQVIGRSWEDRLDWVIGGYYFHEDGMANNPQMFANVTAAFSAPVSLDSRQKFDNDAYAVFGHATLALRDLDPLPEALEAFELTAGVRYTYEDREQERSFAVLSSPDPLPFTPFQTVPLILTMPAQGNFLKQDKTFDRLSPMGVIQYNTPQEWLPGCVDEFNTYFKISEGFKSGGFNGRATSEDAFRQPFNEEILTAYEAGFRSRFFDGRVQLNGTGFWSVYDDLQVTVFRAGAGGGAETSVINAADARIWGAEIELTALLYEGLTFRAGYGLIRPEYKNFTDCVPNAGPGGDPADCTVRDVTDLYDFALSPEHSITLGLAYTLPPFRFGTLTFQVDGYWQDDSVVAIKDNDLNGIDDYGLLNARITLADVPVPNDMGLLDVAIWGRNLTDQEYREFGIDFGEFGFAGNTYGDPRTYGVDLRWRWEGIEL